MIWCVSSHSCELFPHSNGVFFILTIFVVYAPNEIIAWSCQGEIKVQHPTVNGSVLILFFNSFPLTFFLLQQFTTL